MDHRSGAGHQLAASDAPAHSLKLGTGTAVDSAFTAYAEEASIRQSFGSGGGGAIDSVFGRTGAIAAAAGDYSASEVENDSAVTGSTVKEALEALLAAIGAGGGGAVDSVFGRTGNIAAQASDYDASQVNNDSGVAGSTVKDALDALDGGKSDTSHAHAASNVTNDSSVTGSSVKDALNTLLSSGGSGGGLDEVDHVGPPYEGSAEYPNFEVGYRVRDALGAVFQLRGTSSVFFWYQESPGLKVGSYTGIGSFPTDADVREGWYLDQYWLRLRTDYGPSSALCTTRWNLDWFIARNAATDYLWVGPPQRIALQPTNGIDHSGAAAFAYALPILPPTSTYAAHMGIDGVFVDGLVSVVYGQSGTPNADNCLRVALYDHAGSGKTLLAHVEYDSAMYARYGDSGDESIEHRLAELTKTSALSADIEEVGDPATYGCALQGLCVYADVRWYHLDSYGGY